MSAFADIPQTNIQALRGLTSSRSLLSCDGSVVDLWDTDDGSGRQKWIIIPVTGHDGVFNIKVFGGNHTDKVFLSSNDDGSVVDLWNVDDASGRQRWQLLPVSSKIPQYFNIKVLTGVKGPKAYLSCSADGRTVDLWSNDDGSGRQRWQVQ